MDHLLIQPFFLTSILFYFIFTPGSRALAYSRLELGLFTPSMFLDSEPEAQDTSHPEGLHLTGSSGGAKLRRPMAGHRQHVPEFLAIGTAARCRRAVLSSVAGSDDLCCLFHTVYIVSPPKGFPRLMRYSCFRGAPRGMPFWLRCLAASGEAGQPLLIPQGGCSPQTA